MMDSRKRLLYQGHSKCKEHTVVDPSIHKYLGSLNGLTRIVLEICPSFGHKVKRIKIEET